MITPFKENGDVDYDAFVRNIERWNGSPLGGYLVLGSNGETPFLTDKEKLSLIELTAQNAGKGRRVLAGTGHESTRQTIRFTNQAARLGAQAALVLTPCYYGDAMDDKALIDHFSAVADASDIPILIYNVPKFTHINISPRAVKILSGHPNIVGMKDSKGDIVQLRAFLRVVPKKFNLIVGSASILYEAVLAGVRSGILALANCAPNHCAAIQALCERGDRTKARQLQGRMLPVNKVTTDTCGIAGLKYAATLVGYEGGYPRSPLQPLSSRAMRMISAALTTARMLPSGEQKSAN
jgi:4-hydroxy-2-oxoglutarate aldolase